MALPVNYLALALLPLLLAFKGQAQDAPTLECPPSFIGAPRLGDQSVSCNATGQIDEASVAFYSAVNGTGDKETLKAPLSGPQYNLMLSANDTVLTFGVLRTFENHFREYNLTVTGPGGSAMQTVEYVRDPNAPPPSAANSLYITVTASIGIACAITLKNLNALL